MATAWPGPGRFRCGVLTTDVPCRVICVLGRPCFGCRVWHIAGHRCKVVIAIVPITFLQHSFQNILIDACVLDSDSGLLQQVRLQGGPGVGGQEARRVRPLLPRASHRSSRLGGRPVRRRRSENSPFRSPRLLMYVSDSDWVDFVKVVHTLKQIPTIQEGIFKGF